MVALAAADVITGLAFVGVGSLRLEQRNGGEGSQNDSKTEHPMRKAAHFGAEIL